MLENMTDRRVRQDDSMLNLVWHAGFPRAVDGRVNLLQVVRMYQTVEFIQ